MKNNRSNDVLFLVVLATCIGCSVDWFAVMSAHEVGHVAAASGLFGPAAIGFSATLTSGALLGLFAGFFGAGRKASI